MVKNRLINPAVFAYTLYVKFEDRRVLLPLLFFAIAPSIMLVVASLMPHAPFTDESQNEFARTIANYYAAPMLGVFTAYYFISEGPSGKKVVAEPDSLTLLFTRSITRFSYVLTKFFAGLIGSFLVLSFGLLFCWMVGMCFGLNKVDISPLAFGTILCNAASWTAVVVFLHCAPVLVSFISYLFLSGAGGMGSLFSHADYSSNQYLMIFKEMCLFMNRWFGDVLPEPISLTNLLGASSLDVYEIALYFSNILLLLYFAAVAMSRREFSYGAD